MRRTVRRFKIMMCDNCIFFTGSYCKLGAHPEDCHSYMGFSEAEKNWDLYANGEEEEDEDE
ncbi:MAG: hypothetical protein H8E13_13185 [Actinobacteria bacterium]|nr:hypothetical protein [Actinomycetota bacterium]